MTSRERAADLHHHVLNINNLKQLYIPMYIFIYIYIYIYITVLYIYIYIAIISYIYLLPYTVITTNVLYYITIEHHVSLPNTCCPQYNGGVV